MLCMTLAISNLKTSFNVNRFKLWNNGIVEALLWLNVMIRTIRYWSLIKGSKTDLAAHPQLVIQYWLLKRFTFRVQSQFKKILSQSESSPTKNQSNALLWPVVRYSDVTTAHAQHFLHLLSISFNPLLGRTRSRGRCWAAIWLFPRPELFRLCAP